MILDVNLRMRLFRAGPVRKGDDLAQRRESAPLDQRLFDELTLIASQAAAAICLCRVPR